MSSTALSSGSLILSSASSSLLVNPSSIFFSYCLLQLCDFCLVLPCISYLFVEVLTVVIHISLIFGEHHYDHYFELLIR